MKLVWSLFTVILLNMSLAYSAYYPVNFNNTAVNVAFSASVSSVSMPSAVPSAIGGINAPSASTSGTSWCSGSTALCANYNGKYPFFAAYTPYPRIGTFNGYNLYQATPTVGFYIERTDIGDISGSAFAFNAWNSAACTASITSQICGWFVQKKGSYATLMNSFYPVKFVLLKKPADGKIEFPSGVLLYEWRGLRDNNNAEKVSLPVNQALATYTSNVGTIEIINTGCTVTPSSITLAHGNLSPGIVAGNIATDKIQVLCQNNADINISLSKPGDGILYSSLRLPLSGEIYSHLAIAVSNTVAGVNDGYDYNAVAHVPFQVSLSSTLATTVPVTTYGNVSGSAILLLNYR
ncbi:hypothetical protein V8N76_003960 [Salmonella enterica]